MKNWWKLLKNPNTSLPIDKILTIRVAIYLLFIKFALRLLPFKNFKTLYNYLIQTRKSKDYNTTEVKEIANAVQVISEIIPFSSACLSQALTTKLLLQSDPNVILKIGVLVERGFEAHAWVEKNGVFIIGESPLTNYVPIWDWS